MKWMGGWSYGDLMEAPPEYVLAVMELIHEEQQRHETMG